MCVAMVIIHTKTLEKKGVDDVTSKESTLELHKPSAMSQGTALFSCGIMETSRWSDVGRGCVVRPRPVGTSLESLWDALPGAGAAGTLSGLLRDLSLSETPSAGGAAPPSKRQCRSLSCSEELAGCRSPWRPQGSRVWTTVEKRRCHSGGSVQRGGASILSTSTLAQGSFCGMQRSSSFSFPTRADLMELPAFAQHQPFTSFTAVVSSSSSDPPCPLSLSQEQISAPDPGGRSETSSPDSTPELDRRSAGQGGLARSRSQPCVLNDKKIGMKRRRPADTHKQRPSLDLAKMTQNQNFQSLSCPGFTGDNCCQSGHTPPSFISPTHQSGILSSASIYVAEPQLSPKEDSSIIDDLDGDFPGDWTAGTTNGKDRELPWAGLYGLKRDVLGGELDIEQIERN
ncbi:protein FAM53B [Electrophorus electricus]|uniref:Family with sequence similarity 53 member B n=1 Tax=Electrophorus electricus TaxID=8005 RepID=A0A4W4E843_ELEEL|nr:protein FAM53B [Electrophorus electricus]XP_026872600.2 protein FAM53B [Electrophorus electricus]XP_026872601.2 protein FAM53B [Electrophorus electricus]XP_026872602.2 protein FAM53B [Electrophorus electricus]